MRSHKLRLWHYSGCGFVDLKVGWHSRWQQWLSRSSASLEMPNLLVLTCPGQTLEATHMGGDHFRWTSAALPLLPQTLLSYTLPGAGPNFK